MTIGRHGHFRLSYQKAGELLVQSKEALYAQCPKTSQIDLLIIFVVDIVQFGTVFKIPSNGCQESCFAYTPDLPFSQFKCPFYSHIRYRP